MGNHRRIFDILPFYFLVFVCCLNFLCKIYKLISDLGMIGLFGLFSMNFGILVFVCLCAFVSNFTWFYVFYQPCVIIYFKKKCNPLLHSHEFLTLLIIFLWWVCSIFMLIVHHRVLALKRESIINVVYTYILVYTYIC